MTTRKHKTKLTAVEAVAGDRDLMKALMKEALQEVLEGEMTDFLRKYVLDKPRITSA